MSLRRPPEAPARLTAVLTAARLSPRTEPLPVVSHSNDTWLVDLSTGPAVLRIGWRGDVGRLEREIAVAGALPPEVPYPVVLGSGRTELDGHALTWTLTERLDGLQVADAWPRLTVTERDRVAHRLAEILRALHGVGVPAEVAARVRDRPPVDLHDLGSIVGVNLNPLPLPHVRALAPLAAQLPFVDPELTAAAVDRMDGLAGHAPVLDDPDRGVLVHSDVHTSNLWWHDGEVSAVLDLEWVRFGPADLELERIADSADADVREGRDDHPALLRILVADYPELVAAPDLSERLLLFSLAQALRQLCVWPPDRPEADLVADHPVRRLRRLVDGDWPAVGALPFG